MKKYIKFLPLLILIITTLSCKKEAFNGLSDVRPTVPVTVTNAIDFRPEPTVSSSLSSGGNIQITLAIPASSGRKIKEITKVATSTSYTAIQSTGTTGFYTAAPIAVGDITYTFTSSLAEYKAKNGGTIPPANNELGRRFYFLITLDDGSIVIPESVRVLVVN